MKGGVVMAAAVQYVFNTAEEFEKAANHYFDDCDEKNETYTIPGLLIALKKYGPKHKTVSRGTLQEWFNGNSCPFLKDVVTDALLRISLAVETDPRYDQRGMTTVKIFLLKQKMLGGLTDQEKEEKKQVEVVVRHDNSVEVTDFQ